MIISVGYRVNSHRGVQFRQWATQVLKEYMIKGFALNDDLLKNAGQGNYFDELLARIRDIRSSEKVFYRKKVVQQFLFNRINGLWMMTSINYRPMYQNMNASFLKFYGAFATDTAFQARHLHNPVKFIGPDPDDDFSTMTGDIEPETWPAFAPQLPSGMIYNIIYGQKYTESSQKIFVIRGIANGLETTLTFKRIGGKWQLMKLEM